VTADDDRFVRLLVAGTELHRIHGLRPGSAAFFDTSPHGRFNLTDTPGQGTCYLALDALGAYVETLGRVLTRSVSDIARRRHSVVTLDRVLRLFDLTRSEARSAYRHENLDLTATIGAGDDYGTPQRLAALTYRDGYDGILYRARHDPGHRHESIALFGPAGPNETDTVFAICNTAEIGLGIVAAGTRTFGIVVLPEHPE
jgi:hypothetical protein